MTRFEMSNVTLDPLKGLPASSPMTVIPDALDVLAPRLGVDVDSDSPEGEQLRSKRWHKLYVPKQPHVPAKSTKAFVMPDRGAGLGLKMKQAAAHFADCGWTARLGKLGIPYSPPAGASDEEIAWAKARRHRHHGPMTVRPSKEVRQAKWAHQS